MVKIQQLFLATVFVIIIEVFCSKLIGNILSEYYESELVKTFKEEWVKYKKPFENAIMTILKENYGQRSMNIYIKHPRNSLTITKGFYLSDNIVHVLFCNMILRDWPNLIMPEVSLSLPGNMLKVEATVGKMFVDTNYRMMRNESAVLYSEAELEERKNSPFSLQQVQSMGKLTLIAEDCFLSGFSIVTFLGSSVAIGHSTYRLVDCKFTVEISSDVGSPPVIAPYFPTEPRKQIENLISVPIRDEMVQNLAGALYSYINTSVIFGKKLPEYSINQRKLFKQTSNYLTRLCEKLNNLTLEEQKGTVELNDFEDYMETKSGEKQITTSLSLKELKLYGLDTAYASHTGGSFEASQLSIADSIRFHSLQIRGKAFYENGTQSNTHNFAVELTDVTVNIIVNIEKEGSKSVNKFDVLFARTFDFSILPWQTNIDERHWYQALVSGYIINEVPARLTEHLSAVLTPAANDEEQNDMKLSEENLQSGEVDRKIKIIPDDDTAADSTKENSGTGSVEDPESQSYGESDDQPLADEMPDSSAEKQESLSNKTQENDVGILVTAPEALLENDDSGSDDTDADTVTAPNLVSQPSNNDKQVLSGLDSDFFSDDKGQKAFISDFENEKKDKESLSDGKSDAFLDKNFFSDDGGNKPFFSDDGHDRMLFSNSDGEKISIKSGDDGGKHSVKSEDDVNNNSDMADNKEEKQVLIFASSENDRNPQSSEVLESKNDKNVLIYPSENDKNQHSSETETNKNTKQVLIFASSENNGDQLNDETAEQSVQQSVPIERNGKNSHGITHYQAVNKRIPTKKIHKRNKKESNNLKLMLRRNPRANTTKEHIRKITMQSVTHAQASKVNNTKSVQNEAHMSDNEIR